jgi:acyl-CoA thioesterase-1
MARWLALGAALLLGFGAVLMVLRTPEEKPGKAKKAEVRELHILAFGDSLIAGYGLPRDQGFAPQLEAVLRERGVAAKVINAGVSGSTAGNGRARIRWTLDAQKRKPDLAILGLGANDMLRGVPADDTREDLEAIMDEFERRDIPVVIAGMMAPPFLGERYTRKFNAIFPALSRKYDAPLYPFFLAGVAGNGAMNLPDRVHPNARGARRMAEGIAPTVIGALPR